MGEGLSSVEEYGMLPFIINIIWRLDMDIKLILIMYVFCIKVNAQHEASKGHRFAKAAEKTRISVAKGGGSFRRQMNCRDDATMACMRTLLWLVKENVALMKWELLKGM